MQRQAYLTSLRSFAALAVVLVHVHYLPEPDVRVPLQIVAYVDAGVLGVPLFYMLSAFTLCFSATGREGEGLLAFYLRRFFRIAPLFYVMTCVYLYYQGIPSIFAVISNFLLFFNVIPTNSVYEGIVWASWSVGVEVLFYAAFPLIFAYAKDIEKSVRFLIVALIIAAVTKFLLAQGLLIPLNVSTADAEKYAVLSIFTNLPYFAFGFLVFHLNALARFMNADSQRQVGKVLLLGGALGLICIPNASDYFMSNPVPLKVMMVLTFGMLVLGLAMHPVASVTNRVTIYLGEISYSIYLTHCLVIWHLMPFYPTIEQQFSNVWISFGLCATLTVAAVIAASTMTYYCIERPFIRLGSHIVRSLNNRKSPTVVPA